MSAPGQSTDQQPWVSAETAALAAYVADPGEIPDAVTRKASLHVLDTLAAVVSGSRLPPGIQAARYAELHGAPGRCSVLGSDLRVSALDAALANGMSAHADETDDSHAPSISHPGCAVVPAALAVGQQVNASGAEVLRAVVVGYDVGTRVVMALGELARPITRSSHSTHAMAGVFGATAAVASLLGLSPTQVRHTLSYAAQSASGVTSWLRDPNHVEKAWVFGGMPATNGARCALMVSAGADGVDDVFADEPNFLDAFGSSVDRSRLVRGQGVDFEISHTNIKKFAVGSPAQAAVEAILEALAERPFEADDVASIEIRLPTYLAGVVDGRDMPNINVQYLVVGTLLDRRFSFDMAHDFDRMHSDQVQALLSRTVMVPDDALPRTRCATVTVTLRDGAVLRHHVAAVRGTADNPMTPEEVALKATDLIEPFLGPDRTASAIEAITHLPEMTDVNELAELLT